MVVTATSRLFVAGTSDCGVVEFHAGMANSDLVSGDCERFLLTRHSEDGIVGRVCVVE